MGLRWEDSWAPMGLGRHRSRSATLPAMGSPDLRRPFARGECCSVLAVALALLGIEACQDVPEPFVGECPSASPPPG